MSSRNKTYHFLAMWCSEGLECIFDVGQAKKKIELWEKSTIFSIIKDQDHTPKPNPIPLQMMITRARFNMQRRYEIYEFTSKLPTREVKNLFKNNAQIIVDWIRENGHKIYSDHEVTNREVIT